jgi:AcrR family transcriptional regulator
LIATLPKIGRPRDQRLDEAVLRAAYEVFLERGYGNASLSEIARRAGVWTPAIYRRWKSKGFVAIDVIDRESSADAMPDTGSIRDDLVELLRQRIRTWKTPLFSHVLTPVLMEASVDPALRKELGRRFFENRQPHTEARILKAIAAGQVRRDASPTELLNLLMGSVAMPLLFAQGLPDESEAPAIVDHLLEGFRAA